MDGHLETLATASLEVEAAELALGEAAHLAATEHLDAAAAQLGALRTAWPSMSAPQQAIVAPAAAGVRRRLDAARAKVPANLALTIGSAVSDPDEETEPPD